MKNTDKEKRATIRVNEGDWELFKQLCKLNESDASKELRKYIKNYITNHSKQVAELLKKGETK
jgi:ribosomal protein S17E